MVTRIFSLSRPTPPAELLGGEGATTDRPFVPSPELEAWTRSTFIAVDGVLANPDHAHLQQAVIGMLWCAIPNARQMQNVVGQSEIGLPRAGRWQRARQMQQLVEWFDAVPDFLITLHADFAAECDDAGFCALVEHELYHCAQERDAAGAPKFRRDGLPSFGLRGHDVGEFVGIVERYGAGAAAGRTADLVRAAATRPTVTPALLRGACGTCGRLVA